MTDVGTEAVPRGCVVAVLVAMAAVVCCGGPVLGFVVAWIVM